MERLFVVLYMAQILVAGAILGNAIRDARAYRTPFGKLFLPYKLQVGMVIWLIISNFVSILCLVL